MTNNRGRMVKNYPNLRDVINGRPLISFKLVCIDSFDDLITKINFQSNDDTDFHVYQVILDGS